MLITIDGYEFDCFEDGKILRLMKSNNWKEIPNTPNHSKGYNAIMINKKQYMRGQIIAHAFLNYDLNDKSVIICYLDQNKLNNSKENLEIREKVINKNTDKDINKEIQINKISKPIKLIILSKKEP